MANCTRCAVKRREGVGLLVGAIRREQTWFVLVVVVIVIKVVVLMVEVLAGFAVTQNKFHTRCEARHLQRDECSGIDTLGCNSLFLL